MVEESNEARIMDESISSFHWDLEANDPKRVKIPPVPSMLRDIKSDKNCYDPMKVSIGPYHHGNPDLCQEENIKLKIAWHLISENGKYDTFRRVADEVCSSHQARRYYSDNPTTRSINDEMFMEMMFRDGCFIVEYMISTVVKSSRGFRLMCSMMNAHSIRLIARDLLLLENQLPFVLIWALMEKIRSEYDRTFILYKFIREVYIKRSSLSKASFVEILDSKPIHLLDLVRKMYVGTKSAREDSNFDGYGNTVSFRSAMELQSIGIHFKTKHACFMSDIHFQSHLISAHLSLPPIDIDNSTEAKFLNMVAYEMSSEDDLGDYKVIDYICFMDSLIDHADDVKVLRSSGILHNALGSDEQVADLFNRIAGHLIPSASAYLKVKEVIQRRYENKRSMWLAEMSQTYFRNPWTIIALIAAILLLGLSIIQTYFTVFPR